MVDRPAEIDNTCGDDDVLYAFVVQGSLPYRVPRPQGTWVTYSWLWGEHLVPRGLLDKLVRAGKVHYTTGATLYLWEDIELIVLEYKASAVEAIMLAVGDD